VLIVKTSQAAVPKIMLARTYSRWFMVKRNCHLTFFFPKNLNFFKRGRSVELSGRHYYSVRNL